VTKLVIDNVSRTFPGVRGGAPVMALTPTNLTVAANDFITILGPSGCGKSTLLRIVAGLDRPSTGEVRLDGRRITGPGADRGMVFQSYTLFPWLTVAQNIAFGLREQGRPEAEIREIVASYIEKVGLRGFENHWPKQLSGGMQQRTAIARALANDPEILLLDEPYQGFDRGTYLDFWDQLWEWRNAGRAIVVVTHLLNHLDRVDTVLDLTPSAPVTGVGQRRAEP